MYQLVDFILPFHLHGECLVCIISGSNCPELQWI